MTDVFIFHEFGITLMQLLLLCHLHLVAASRSYTCAQDGLDTYCMVVFFLGALAHLLMRTQTNRHILQLALCGGGNMISTTNNTTTPQ